MSNLCGYKRKSCDTLYENGLAIMKKNYNKMCNTNDTLTAA